MADYGVDALAIDAFTDQYRRVESGESGIMAESTIEPLDMDRLADAHVPDGGRPQSPVARPWSSSSTAGWEPPWASNMPNRC